jgi:hypothetical protein
MDENELQAINTREVEGDSNSTEQNLPRADGGKDAYLVLASVFVQGALVWGKTMILRVWIRLQANHREGSCTEFSKNTIRDNRNSLVTCRVLLLLAQQDRLVPLTIDVPDSPINRSIGHNVSHIADCVRLLSTVSRMA